VTLQKHFSHPSFSYLVFSNPAHKTKTGIAIGGRLLIATHLVQSKLFSQSETQGAINKQDLIAIIRLFQEGPGKSAFFQGPSQQSSNGFTGYDSCTSPSRCAFFQRSHHSSNDSLNMTAALRPPDVHFSKGHTSFPMDSLDMTAALGPPDVHVSKGHFQWIHWI
jgi:hypothetical protein